MEGSLSLPDATTRAVTKPHGPNGLVTPGADEAVVFAGVRKRYDATQALNDTNLTVRRGEFFVMLGPSGSGKTTLLMCLAGFTAPDAGAIRVLGRDITTVEPHKRNLGVVFQNYALFPHLDVKRNVAYPLKMRGWSRERAMARVQEVLERVQLSGYQDRRPHQLSGGQQQRVAVARALAFEPDVLLMDEPLGALDRKLREQLQVELHDIQRRTGITVVYVTHDQDEAMTLADRIAIMCAGDIVQIGTAHELYGSPANSFVAAFLGQANLIGVAGQGGSDPRHVVTGDGATVPVANAAELTADVHAHALLIRPEGLAATAPDDPARHFDGEIVAVQYLGDRSFIRVRLSDQTVVLARCAETFDQGCEGARVGLRALDGQARLVRR